MSRGTVEQVDPKRPGSLMGTSELTNELGVPRSTVARWIRDGVLPRPVDALAATPVWASRDIARFKVKREREAAKREEAKREREAARA